MNTYPTGTFRITAVLACTLLGMKVAHGFEQGKHMQTTLVTFPHGFSVSSSEAKEVHRDKVLQGKIVWSETFSGGFSSDVGASYAMSPGGDRGGGSVKPHAQLSKEIVGKEESQRLYMRFDVTPSSGKNETALEAALGIRDTRKVSRQTSIVQEAVIHSSNEHLTGIAYQAALGWDIHESISLSVPRIRVWIPADGQSEAIVSVSGRVRMRF